MSYADAYDRLIARNYDASYAVTRDPCDDGRFYRELARELGGPVLELGCGTGRILLPIANDGVEAAPRCRCAGSIASSSNTCSRAADSKT